MLWIDTGDNESLFAIGPPGSLMVHRGQGSEVGELRYYGTSGSPFVIAVHRDRYVLEELMRRIARSDGIVYVPDVIRQVEEAVASFRKEIEQARKMGGGEPASSC